MAIKGNGVEIDRPEAILRTRLDQAKASRVDFAGFTRRTHDINRAYTQRVKEY
jgi:hypothetical protein